MLSERVSTIAFHSAAQEWTKHALFNTSRINCAKIGKDWYFKTCPAEHKLFLPRMNQMREVYVDALQFV